MSFFGANSTAANVSSAPEKDVEVADPPPDSISSLSFCPVADFLAVGCWDNNVSLLFFCFVGICSHGIAAPIGTDI
jgi:mRNA export factor